MRIKTLSPGANLPGVQLLGLSVAVFLALAGCGGEVEFSGGSKPPAEQGAPVLTSQEFLAGTVESSKLQFNLTDETLEQELVLKAGARTLDSHRQIERLLHRESFTQGHDGDSVTKTFPVREAGKLDLLVVIDDSPSMKPYQDRLAPQLDPVLRFIGNTDWQIGVITTSPTPGTDEFGCLRGGEGRGYPKILTKAAYDADPEKVKADFARAVTAGDRGKNVERGVFASVMGLRGDCGNSGRKWVREGSNVAVLIVTDEDNCGSAPNENCRDMPGEFPDYFVRNAPPGTKFLGILYDEDTEPCSFQGWRKPEQYWSLVAETGGIWGNMCETDYTDILERISAHIGPVVRYDYELEHEPVPGTLIVSLDGVDVTPSTNLTGRTLRISMQVPDAAKDLTVSYLHSPQPKLRRFNLSHPAAEDSVSVKVNGEMMERSAYLIDSERGELEFNELPADNAAIDVEYRENSQLPAVFRIDREFQTGTVQVTVDGNGAAFLQTGEKTITLQSPPPDGALVEISYETRGNRTLTYPLPTDIDSEPEKLRAFDRKSGREIKVTQEGDSAVFDWSDVANGRVVSLIQTLRPADDLFAVALPSNYIEDSIVAVTEDGSSDCVDAAEAQNGRFVFPCPGRDLRSLALSFSYVRDWSNKFTMPGEYVPQSDWFVYINGIETKDFVREGSTVTVNKELLPPGTSVRIEVYEPKWAKKDS